MSLWEYKMITSGRGGFASPGAHGKISERSRQRRLGDRFVSKFSRDNILAFNGLARRTTQRDWTLQDAAAAAAKVEAEKLRAEFESKFKSATSTAPAANTEERPESLADKAAPEDGFRKPRDTERDSDPDAHEEEHAKDEWDELGEEDDAVVLRCDEAAHAPQSTRSGHVGGRGFPGEEVGLQRRRCDRGA